MRDKVRTRLQSKSKVYFLLFGTKFSILESQESMTGKLKVLSVRLYVFFSAILFSSRAISSKVEVGIGFFFKKVLTGFFFFLSDLIGCF